MMNTSGILQKVLSVSLNRYYLDLPGSTFSTDVEEIEGKEEMSELYCYTVRFTSDAGDIQPQQMLRKKVWLNMQASSDELKSVFPEKIVKVIHGVITHFRRLQGSRDQVSYEIIIEPFVSLLGKQFHSHRFFVNKSVPEVVTKILTEHGLEAWQYQFSLKQSYPKREQINQYQESDLKFIQRLLAEVGIFFYFRLQEDARTEVIHFGDSQVSFNTVKSLPLNSPSGMDDGGKDSIWELNLNHQVVEASVSAKDYNHREAQYILRSAEADMTRGDGDATNYGKVYHYRPRHPQSGDKYTPAAETANFYARLDHERFLASRTSITGISTDPSLAAGQTLIMTDNSVPSTLPELLHNPLVIIKLKFVASRESAMRVTIGAVPYSETICWRPAMLVRPKVSGTMTARVTSAKDNDIYAWQDASGLYRVVFDADEESKDRGQESMPVRLAKPYGGDMYGFHFPLIQGTEVAIAFREGDPDQPYIAHALHDSRHVDHVTEKNSTRNVIRTAGLNKLRMEDKRGEEHVKLSTEYGGKSQLSLGHLVDSSRAKRGEGFELRTDKWGGIRAGSGIFISADKQPGAGAEVLEMQDALNRLHNAGNQMQQLADDGKAAGAEPAQVETQLNFMREELEQLKQAVALLSAPQGIALTSGKHLQLAAAKNLIATAEADADVGIVKRMFIGVGEGLNVFVRRMGIKLLANQGPVSIQAQNDQLQLLARQGLEITSTEEEIHIIAKKKIVLNAGGSYITLDPCKIELGTDGDFAVKSADFAYSGPASMTAEHPEYPEIQSTAKQLLNLKVPMSPDAEAGSWAGMPYTLYADGAAIKQGVLDNTGNLPVEHQTVTKSYRLVMANGVSYQIPVAATYRNPEQGVLANRGIHHHHSQPAEEINAPDSHTGHRSLYAALLDGINDREKDA
ncbi:type VI secretion system tip protein VgrG [Pantoea sp. SORGH_AS_0659]|uniref:type VI secretion system Vgr family protein n=1 Tax=Pantoea sp. SORGH_AS_0659 TaxID=3062597 RepID=UPI00285B8D09|nr:type VI secretion system tip protein VgrG [Pantoea sp. SORGH_AS_0659]MDR6350082.1 type VI secretion system secreted protein VgrG [Pantoea sp. SORGH_AS_0659]